MRLSASAALLARRSAPAGPRGCRTSVSRRLPTTTRPQDLTLEITLDDGRVKRFTNPVVVNRATSTNPPPRLIGRVSLREIRMRRAGGPDDKPAYRGTYDGTRGSRRPIVAGRLYRFSVLLCGDSCTTRHRQARLR